VVNDAYQAVQADDALAIMLLPDLTFNFDFPFSGLWKGVDDCGHSVYFKGAALYLDLILFFFPKKKET